MAAAVQQFSPDSLKTLCLSELIDQFGPIDEAHRAAKALERKHEAYRKEIERRQEAAPADAEAVLNGARYSVRVGPKATERKIFDPARAFNAMKAALGLDGCKAKVRFLLADVDAVISLGDQRHFIKAERTGRRPVEATPLIASIKASKAA